MLAILNIVLPVFALILLGYVLRKKQFLTDETCTQLNRFVIYLALPALLCHILLNTPWQSLYQFEFLCAFEIGYFGLLIAVLLVHWIKTKNVANATIEATSAAYGNTGYIGIPLCALAFGANQLAPTMVITVLTSTFNFILPIVLMEFARKTGGSIFQIIKQVCVSLIKNPLIVAPVVAVIFSISGYHLPGGVEESIHLLGEAACPCALVATGVFLAQRNESVSKGVTVELVLLKLIGQPVLVWYLVTYVFSMPPLWAKSAIILAAMPTGTGPFMLAELYGKGGPMASRTIFLTTALSVISLSFWLYVIST